MKTGLVLEGGALRCLFTAGIIDVFMENNIPFDGMIGVSAGALFGCNYKSFQPGRVIRYNLKYYNDYRFGSIRSLIKTGDLYDAQFCYHDLPEKLDIFDYETFRNSPMEFYVVCTDVDTGEPVYKKCDTANHEDMEWLRASASLPLAAKIVEINGQKLLDGGLADSIPLEYFNSIGYDKNVVIRTRPRDYIRKQTKSMPLIRKTMKKYPNFIATMHRRPDMYNKQLEYIENAEKSGDAYVICPDEPLDIGYTAKEPEQIKEIYNIGREAGIKNLNDVKKFLEIE